MGRKRVKRLFEEYLRYRILYGLANKDRIMEHGLYLREIKRMDEYRKKSCNVCAIQGKCRYAPKWGEPVRFNCPFFKKEAEEA